MKVLFIYRNPTMGFSIGKVFHPIEQEMKKKCQIESLYLPCSDYSTLIPQHYYKIFFLST